MSATQPGAQRQPVAEVEVLIFELSAQRFALPLQDVLEVVRAVAMRALPNAPTVVEGIVDLRGEVVPVLDIRARFGLPSKPLEVSDHFVVGCAGPRHVILRVDRALALTYLRALSIEQAINLPRGVQHIAGVASLEDGLVLLHDLSLFLSEVEDESLARELGERPAWPAQTERAG
jgi:purine-binding chemotaxis protein CheW